LGTSAPARATIADAPADRRNRTSALPADLRVARPRWLTVYTGALVAVDGAAMAMATFTAKASWLGIDPEPLVVREYTVPYSALVLVTVPTWLVILALTGAYDLGPLGRSRGAWTHIVRAGAQLLAVVALSYYILHLATLGRGVLVALVPLAVALTILGRAVAEATLDELRRRGRARRTAFVLGSRRGVEGFVAQVESRPAAGITVVGKATIDAPAAPARDGHANGHNGRHGDTTGGVPAWQPSLVVVHDTLARTRAEALVVAGGLAPGRLREVAWMLEGTGVELLVMPTPADTEGLRAAVRPVAGLPLLRLER
jgi:FlaA1/EpsC-like NDP-sugar epimerase